MLEHFGHRPAIRSGALAPARGWHAVDGSANAARCESSRVNTSRRCVCMVYLFIQRLDQAETMPLQRIATATHSRMNAERRRNTLVPVSPSDCDQARRETVAQVHGQRNDRNANQVGDEDERRERPARAARAERDGDRNGARSDGQRKRQRVEATARHLALPRLRHRRRRRLRGFSGMQQPPSGGEQHEPAGDAHDRQRDAEERQDVATRTSIAAASRTNALRATTVARWRRA